MSQGQLWPFPGTNGQSIDCASFAYKDDHDPFIYNYQSKYFKTLTLESDTVYVNCHLGNTKHFEVIYADGTKCKGLISQDGLSTETKMKLTLNSDCPGRQTEQEFACLDSTKHMYSSKQLIVTESLDNNAVRIKCWVFPAFHENLFYLLSLEDCNEGAHERVNSNHIKPIATFQVMPDIQIEIVTVGRKSNKPVSATVPGADFQSPQNSVNSKIPTYKNDIKSSPDVQNGNDGESQNDISTRNVPRDVVFGAGHGHSERISLHIFCSALHCLMLMLTLTW